MSDKIVVRYSLSSTWDIVKNIKDEIKRCFSSKETELLDATMMTAAELIENAVKYGGVTPDGVGVQFELKIDDNRINIEVSNSVVSEENCKILEEHIEKINSSDNPAELYNQRLMELMENPKPGESQLGIYRIVYEGEFKLDYKYSDNKLIITARRDI